MKAGTKQPVIKFEAYPHDERLCIVVLLRKYISRTSSTRGSNTQLLLSYIKPFKPVSRDTTSHWVKTVVENAGIDTKKFKPHSTRAASTLAANTSAVPLVDLLSAAGWKSDCTFAKYCNKVLSKNSFARGVLETLSSQTTVSLIKFYIMAL